MIDTIRLILDFERNAEWHHLACIAERNVDGYLIGNNDKVFRRDITVDDFALIRETTRKTHKTEASSHYKYIIHADPPSNTVDVEFSLPKFKYGTNVFQLVPGLMNPRFTYDTDKLSSVYKVASPDAWFELIATLKECLFKMAGGFEADLTGSRLMRIDLCWNQVFDTPKGAMEYQDRQRLVKKKYWRKEKNISYYSNEEGSTDIFFGNKKYAFKIYHKGPEFAKNDIKELRRVKALDKKGNVVAANNVEQIQEFANRCLRYEMTFRSEKISEIYVAQFYRSKDRNRANALYKRLLNLARNLENKYKPFNSPLIAFKNYLGVHGDFAHKVCRLYETCTKQINSIDYDYNDIWKWIKKHEKIELEPRKIYLGDPEKLGIDSIVDTDIVFNLDHEKRVPFTRSLFFELLHFFLQTVEQFQLSKGDFQTVNNYISQYNDKVEMAKRFGDDTMSRINKSSVLPYWNYVRKHGFIGMRKFFGLSESGYYKVKKRLKDLGIDERTLLISDQVFPTPGFLRYYEFLQMGGYYFR